MHVSRALKICWIWIWYEMPCWFLFTRSKLWLLISNHRIHISTSYSRSRLFWLLTHTLKKEKKNVPLTLLPSNMMTTSLWAYSWISVSHAWNNRSRHSNKLTASPAKQEGSVIIFDLAPKFYLFNNSPVRPAEPHSSPGLGWVPDLP